jgi:hypothetical protein
MRKYIQYLIVFALVLGAVGVASSNPAWASSISAAVQGIGINNPFLPTAVTVTGNGTYDIGGICTFTIAYTATGLQDKADSEVPIADSMKVPFSGKGQLYYPGCHIVHYKADKIVNEASTSDGSWKVCFGARPDTQTTIYYYLDTPVSGSPVWAPLPTTLDKGFACASAVFTGVYMPAGLVITNPPFTQTGGGNNPPPPKNRSTVLPPPPNPGVITGSGSYSAGGICTLFTTYYVTGLSDIFHVQPSPVQDTKDVPFPDNSGVFYFPGCHVIHDQNGQPQAQMGTDKGVWKICFAARPDKTMTIYYYTALDDANNWKAPWVALDSTTTNGTVCAPAQESGIYVPTGK